MRKWLAGLLAAILIFSLCACGNAPVSPETEDPTETSIPETTEQTQPQEETEPAVVGEILLSVSSITLSLVGDSEDIYIGSADREVVTWESADPAVVTFEAGLVTATGVGSTTVTARYGDQQLTCSVTCLAETEEELMKLDDSVLRAPKRYPAVLENPPLEFFDDAVIIGDSISYILFQYETMHGLLGNPQFLVRGGTGLNGLVLRYYNISYKGQEMFIEDAVAATGAKKVFIMLGQNDLRYRTLEDTMSSWDPLIQRILEKNPDAEIYIQSCIYEWYPTGHENSVNDKIDAFNQQVIAYAQEHGYHYVDIQQYVEDHTRRMATEYSMDQSIHLNEAGCIAWMHALNLYAYQQTIGGNEP